jgi:cytochrome c
LARANAIGHPGAYLSSSMFSGVSDQNRTMRANYLIPTAFAALILAACNGSETAPGVSNAPAPAVPAPTLAELPAPWNTADLGAGASLYLKCKACHSLVAKEGARVGPNLHGVFDRPPAAAPKFKYSPALQAFTEERWTPELVDQWLANPKTFLPGNSMFFDGLAKEEDRRNLIAWLLIETRK